MANRRHRFARRAARTLSWALGFFLLCQIGLALALETWWTNARDPWYGPRAARLRDRLAKTKDARVVVMVGTSRTWDGFRAAPFEANLARELGQPLVLFNMGIQGAGPVGHLLQLKRMLADGVRPDLLLIEIFPPMLDDRFPIEAYRKAPERLSWRDLQRLKRDSINAQALRRAWCEARAAPCYAQRFNILSLVLPSMLPVPLRVDAYMRCDGCGWFPHDLPASRLEESLASRRNALANYLPTLESFQIGPSISRTVTLLLEECRRRHIKAAFVLMPEGPYFRSGYPREVWRQIDPFLDRLRREYDVPTINARYWMGEENFIDSHHLRPEGAFRFSERLGREAILPLLRQDRVVRKD